MNHNQKVAYFEQMLRDRGHRISDAIPPIWRLLWRLGVKLPPPYFLPFWLGVVAVGPPFGVIWGLIMWVIFWRSQGISSGMVLATVAIAGLLFGLLMSTFWFLQAKKLQLPNWHRFPSQD